MSAEDPLEWVSSPDEDAYWEEYYANLAPPEWFYPFVGRVASEAVLLELYVTEAALALTKVEGTARDLIKSSRRMWDALKAAKGLDDRFDDLLGAFQPARDGRDAIVHAVLFWKESDGPYSDYWEHHHPKTDNFTHLPTHGPTEWMQAALISLQTLTQRAFELSNELSRAKGESPTSTPPF